jgi:gliding motility-associated-like protein
MDGFFMHPPETPMKQYLTPLYLVLLLFPALTGLCQSTNPYHINGNASQENCNCYTLTPNTGNQSGSVWNIYKINLRESFDYKFEVFLGCTDAGGADGIAFVLQPVSTSIGTVGGGIGYEGVIPSVGVVIDTWQNTIYNDPFYDHITIHTNGNINHSGPATTAGPVTALDGNDNIEDCKWHSLRITWDAVTKKLNAQVDGVDRVSLTTDLVRDIFAGNPEVFWGFTGSTGGSMNHQRFCTSLNPSFSIQPDYPTCYPATLEFKDSSRSFGSILKWYWDFGDGSKDSSANPPPHTYSQPGKYKSSLKILGNNGCVSEAFVNEIVIGSVPIADFRHLPALHCEGDTIQLIDSSYVEFGTINSWEWIVDGQPFSGQQPDIIQPTTTGTIPVQLSVKTKEGCEATSVVKYVAIHPVPDVGFSLVPAACTDDFIVLNAENYSAGTSIAQWNWKLDNGNTKSGSTIRHQFTEKGKYEVKLTALAANGCQSFTVLKTINIDGTKAFAGNDTVVAVNQPLQLQASGGESYRWSPAANLNDPFSINPVATLQQDAVYVLTAAAAGGCETTDSVKIKVYKGPDIYVPSAFAPDGSGRNSRFRAIAPGLRIDFFHVYNRYGQLIFTGRAEEGWNGEWNGKKQPTGTYVWMIRGKDYLGKEHFRKGTVTLIR